MAKNILSLAYKDALDYFMSASNYSTLELPDYLDMTPVLKHVRKTIGAKAFADCVECNPISNEALNYTMNLNKDGKYAIRPIALVNPYIYYFFAREICSQDNWNYLKAWFKLCSNLQLQLVLFRSLQKRKKPSITQQRY